MNTIGWITLTASIMIVPPQIMVGIVRFFNTAYVIQRWHVFLIYQGLLVLSLLYNIFALQPMPWAHDIGCKCSNLLFAEFQAKQRAPSSNGKSLAIDHSD